MPPFINVYTRAFALCASSFPSGMYFHYLLLLIALLLPRFIAALNSPPSGAITIGAGKDYATLSEALQDESSNVSGFRNRQWGWNKELTVSFSVDTFFSPCAQTPLPIDIFYLCRNLYWASLDLSPKHQDIWTD